MRIEYAARSIAETCIKIFSYLLLKPLLLKPRF